MGLNVTDLNVQRDSNVREIYTSTLKSLRLFNVWDISLFQKIKCLKPLNVSDI